MSWDRNRARLSMFLSLHIVYVVYTLMRGCNEGNLYAKHGSVLDGWGAVRPVADDRADKNYRNFTE